MRYIFYLIGIVVIIGITFGLFNVWGWHGLVPNLLLLIIISISLAFNNLDYLIVGFFGGIWFDILYGLPVGSFSIPFVLSGLFSSLAFQRWFFTEVTSKHFILITLLATLLLNGWLWLYTNALYIVEWSPVAVYGNQMIRNILLLLIANMLLAYPVYVIVEMIAQSTTRFKRNKIRL